MTTVAVIGIGAMGLGIAQVYAMAGNQVLATDADPMSRATAPDRMAATLQQRVTAGKMTPQAREDVLARFTVVDALRGLAPADLAIEAIVEAHAAKASLLADLEGILSPDAVIASNTSSLSITALAKGLQRPARFLGLHFFNPAPAMRLVELIGHPGTGPAALAMARRVTESAGKTVVTCPDTPGFIVNRCARPYYGEALAMLEEGRVAAEIDAAMQGAGYRLGPFALIDLIGADVNLAATEGLYAAFGNHPRYFPFAALRRRVASGHLGRKSGMGFVYPEARTATPKDAGDIVTRIEATMINEAAWLLASGDIAQNEIDTALKLGLNFPRGPFEMLADYGKTVIRDRLAVLAASAPAHLAGRYNPAPLIQQS